MPPTQEPPSRNNPSAHTTLFGAIALALLALASFFVVFTYLDAIRQPAPMQTAAVVAVNPFSTVAIEGDAAIVVDLVSGEVLYEKNADAQLALASITKIPLAIVVAESMSIDSKITIPYDTAPQGSKQRLAAGETWKLQDVIDFTLIASSNPGAEILAGASDEAVRNKYPVAPVGGAALWRMNNLASELGLTNTYFLNVSGLDESLTQSGAYGSARDVAKIFAYAAHTYPHVFSGTTNDGVLLAAENGSTTSAVNTNEALDQIPGLMMGKTGFTDIAGGNLAVVFDVGLAHPVVAVVLGSSREGRFADIEALVKAARARVMQ